MERFNRQSEAIAESTGRINFLQDQLINELIHRAQLMGVKPPVTHIIPVIRYETVFERRKNGS